MDFHVPRKKIMVLTNFDQQKDHGDPQWAQNTNQKKYRPSHPSAQWHNEFITFNGTWTWIKVYQGSTPVSVFIWTKPSKNNQPELLSSNAQNKALLTQNPGAVRVNHFEQLLEVHFIDVHYPQAALELRISPRTRHDVIQSQQASKPKCLDHCIFAKAVFKNICWLFCWGCHA